LGPGKNTEITPPAVLGSQDNLLVLGQAVLQSSRPLELSMILGYEGLGETWAMVYWPEGAVFWSFPPQNQES